MGLFETVTANPRPPGLELGWINVPKLLDRVRVCEQSPLPLSDEQVLTYLCAYGYAVEPGGPGRFARTLVPEVGDVHPGPLWFEFLPPVVRDGEGETHLDLAFGDVRRRAGTISGIEFAGGPNSPSRLVAVEAKLQSDISCDVTADPFRNQLLRVIESACMIRDQTGRTAELVHVVLLTPLVFREHPRSRFYGCKFHDYSIRSTDPAGRGYAANVGAIQDDLDRLRLSAVPQTAAVADRLPAVRLHWATYEELIGGMSPGEFRTSLLALVNRPGSLVTVPG